MQTKLSKINFKILPLSIPVLLLCCYTIGACSCFVNIWQPPFCFGQKSLLGGESEQSMLFIKQIMSLHFGWTRGVNIVFFGPKYHWWKQIQIWILTCWFF